MANLNERETETSRVIRTELAPWDAHIVPVVVPPGAGCIGKTLLELRWRETIGINVVMIKRGDQHLAAPGKEQMIFPGDELLVLGTDLQLQKLRVLVKPEAAGALSDVDEVELHTLLIEKGNVLAGKSVRTAGLREKVNALVVGIERNNERILNPESETQLTVGDVLFIVANRKKLKEFLLRNQKESAQKGASSVKRNAD